MDLHSINKLSKKDKKRFWEKVNKTTNSSCWEWKAFINPQGYGKFQHNGKSLLAHRVAYFLANNYDSLNNWVLHKCDNPKCVNPNHLYLGSPKDNTRDMVERGRLKTPNLKGNSHPSSRLTQKEVEKIRVKYKTGNFTQKELSKLFNTTQGHISRLVNRVRW